MVYLFDDMSISLQSLEILKTFLQFCIKELKFKTSCDIEISLLDENLEGIPTTGFLDVDNNRIVISVKGRLLADWLRTLAHELTHLKQKLVDNAKFPNDDDGLQVFEDEANVMAGRLVRFFGRKHPKIYREFHDDNE